MSRNVYLGADLSAALESQDFAQLAVADADILDEVIRTDFPSRAVLLAREIKKAKPDLVGLQEVSLWRIDTEPPINDLGDDFGGTPAETVVYDFLAELRSELKRQGANYRVAVQTEEFDFELPVEARPGDPQPDDASSTYDGRLTTYNVILARKGVKTTKPKGGVFEDLYSATVAGGVQIPVTRGWQSVQATVDGEKFRVVHTHLEAFDDGTIREAQAEELVGGPAKSNGNVVLIGDLNSGTHKQLKNDPGASKADELAFSAVLDGGFLSRQTSDFSCCFASSLNDPKDKFNHTVDHLLVNNKQIKLGDSFITGNDKNQRTATGLWPADHGGVVSTLVFP